MSAKRRPNTAPATHYESGIRLDNAVWPEQDRVSQRALAENFLGMEPSPETLRSLLKNGLDPLDTLLACIKRAVPPSVVSLLLKDEAAGLRSRLDEGAEDAHYEGMLPLQLAASDASPEVVRLLLRYGADPNRRNPDPATSDGITPLWIAADYARARVARLLIACGGRHASIGKLCRRLTRASASCGDKRCCPRWAAAGTGCS